MAQTDNLINSEIFLKTIKNQVNRDMLAAAEPLVKDALIRIERDMRKALAINIIGFINHNFNVTTNADYLQIQIKQN